ncbi:MAG TPA: hypothetical protein VMZ91_14735 [Candidatus Paceibacterota bacterium]|nr:hypothetical protein [Candidatus Paceibacterota bacterium]
MFNKNKKKQIEQVAEQLDTVPFQSAIQREEQLQKVQQPIAPIQPPQPETKARIIGCELDPETGLWKFTFLSNAPMGEVGQEFDI